MSNHPDILAALARERQQAMLARAGAARLARQARSARRGHAAPAIPRSPLRRSLDRLPPAWGRLLSWRAGTGAPAA